MINLNYINGCAHITGGGIRDNTLRILDDGQDIEIDWNCWERPAIFNLEDYVFDYALTIANWRQRFETEIQNVMAMGFDREFIRMWRFYLSYCEGGVRERSLSDVQMLFVKHGYKNRPWRVQST